MGLVVILAVIAVFSGIPALIRYKNRRRDGIETDAVISRIDWFPEDENDHDYYLFREVYGRERQGQGTLGIPFHDQQRLRRRTLSENRRLFDAERRIVTSGGAKRSPPTLNYYDSLYRVVHS